MRERRAREQLERRVVVDLSVLENAAVPVVGVLAHADVGDHYQIGYLFLQGLHPFLDRGVFVPRRGADGVLRLGYPEENHSSDLRFRRSFCVTQHLINGSLIHTRHRVDGAAQVLAVTNEDWQHELRRREWPITGKTRHLLWLWRGNFRELPELDEQTASTA